MATDEKFAKNLDDEQLDEVAGGTKAEMKKDIAFLNAIGEEKGVNLSKNATAQQIEAAWELVGYYGNPSTDKPNEYGDASSKAAQILDGGKSISRQDAMILAMRKTKKVVNLDDYL